MAETKSIDSSYDSSDQFERECWKMADKLRNNMDSAEYKHVVLGLIFLKYVSDAFDQYRENLKTDFNTPGHEDYIENPEDREEELENRDMYSRANVFWVPSTARWNDLKANAKQPNIGKLVDEAMSAIERENPTLKNVLSKDYARPTLDSTVLGGLIDLVSRIPLVDKQSKEKDLLGHVYEYFLSQFASAEGKKGGEFYTPQCVVKLLVEMISPYHGRVFDPCCGSGGMFVQSEKFIERHEGKIGDISIFGQESNATTWRLARMNLAIRHIEGNLGKEHADSFRNDLHSTLKADYILANPPFNMSDWGGEPLRQDVRWKYGVPPINNANYAWIQHFIHHLSDEGVAGFVLANGSMSTNMSGEGEIRQRIIEDDLVDCMVALPGQLFYSTQIPVCLWFIARDKKNHRFRDRRSEILFIDARKMGSMRDRIHRDLTSDDINKITGKYHAWRKDPDSENYTDELGFCKRVSLDQIKENGYVLTPGRYVGAEEIAYDSEPFEDKMLRLSGSLKEQFAESARLEKMITKNLNELGYEF